MPDVGATDFSGTGFLSGNVIVSATVAVFEVVVSSPVGESFSFGHSDGIVSVKVEPLPNSLCTVRFPPSIRA